MTGSSNSSDSTGNGSERSARRVELVCCFDERFLVGFVVMLQSFRGLCPADVTISLHLLYVKIEPATLGRIQSWVDEVGVSIQLQRIDTTPLNGVSTPAHLSLEAYFRLLIPSLLPVGLSKVLYLDCDLLITDNPMEIWDTPMDGKLIGAVGGRNSGVMVLNLDLWREQGIGGKLIQFARDYPERCPMADNSAIVENIQWDEYSFFDCRWNMSHEVGNGHKGIVHFIGATKPWNHYYPNNGHRKLFYDRLDETPWAGWRPEPPSIRARLIHGLRTSRKRFPWLGKIVDRIPQTWFARRLRSASR